MQAAKRELIQGSVDVSDIIEFSKKVSDDRVQKKLAELVSTHLL